MFTDGEEKERRMIYMNANRDELLKMISVLDFFIIDLHLYLNTHPTDKDAIQKYNRAVKRAKELREEYERSYGMLMPIGTASECPWQWIEEPWPWQYKFNFELAGDECNVGL
jgi:spore coat protein JB